ncbi:MAG: hypothetical protein M3437_06470 [Chloroflexota bacterium]|nr:hypothetical protein [Chloroflexota bacterium]MDQ5864867.1 hypothetical protein [Chloroflexota bacterium]
MVKAATNELVAQAESAYPREYAPSWIDRLTAWVRRLPGQGWWLYLCAGLVSLAVQIGAAWSDTNSFEWLRPSSVVLIWLPFLLLAFTQYLDDAAETALARFRPALTASRAEYHRLHYRLTTLPAVPVLLATVAGVLFGASVLFFQDRAFLLGIGLIMTPTAFLLQAANYMVLWSLALVFAYHTVRQLWLVRYIYSVDTRIDLFDLRPIYALSGLTARTAVVGILLANSWKWAVPDEELRPEHIGMMLVVFLIALASFAVPLWGMHNMLVEEKARQQVELARRMDTAIAEIKRRMDAGEVAEMEQMKNSMESLTLAQGVLEKVPTWPWQADTIRAIATALLLPIMLWLIQRGLERFLVP